MGNNRPRKVLIIDDEERVRERIRRTFEFDEDEFTFEVKDVGTIEEAEKILKYESRYDLVIIDWRLKKEDSGYDVLKILEKLFTYFPILKIVYTAYPTYDNCVKAMNAGSNHYIDKNEKNSLEKLLNVSKELLRERKHIDKNVPDPKWLEDHYDELAEKYPYEFIAFIDGKMVGHAPTKKVLEIFLKDNYPDEVPYILIASREF